MLVLLVLIISGIAAAIFATQNTQVTSIALGPYAFSNIPVYLVTLGALLVGILVSLIIHLINSISASFTMRGKDGTLSGLKREITEQNREIHKLEIENTRLKTRLGEVEEDDNSI